MPWQPLGRHVCGEDHHEAVTGTYPVAAPVGERKALAIGLEQADRNSQGRA